MAPARSLSVTGSDSPVKKTQYRRRIAAMIGSYIDARPPRARERRWREPLHTPGKRGRLTARTLAAVSSPGAISSTLLFGLDRQRLHECAIVADLRRLQPGHFALVVPLPDTHGFLVKALGLEPGDLMRRHGAALQFQRDDGGGT